MRRLAAVVLAELLIGLVERRLGARRLTDLHDGHAAQRDIAHYQVCEIAGRPINVNSPDSVSAFLFDDLKLPCAKSTRSGNRSTDDEALESLIDQHPVIELIRRHRRHQIVASAAAGLLSCIAPGEQRVVGRLDPQGATTGRFSCSEPNLQGLPADLLAAIVAPPGHQLIEADYSQIELRVLAALSQDQRLLDAFQNDADVHAQTASMVFSVPPESISDAQRRIGKDVNFGIIFGQTPVGLANKLRVREDEAASAIERFFAGYPAVRPWIQQTETFAATHGFVQTLYGRRRRLVGLYDPTASRGILRQAVNAVIQGTAADILKMALARVYRGLRNSSRALLTVHDSILLEAPDREVEDIEPVLRDLMEQAPPGFTLPLKVRIHSGRSWAECKAG
jgi:DNA polymerase I